MKNFTTKNAFIYIILIALAFFIFIFDLRIKIDENKLNIEKNKYDISVYYRNIDSFNELIRLTNTIYVKVPNPTGPGRIITHINDGNIKDVTEDCIYAYVPYYDYVDCGKALLINRKDVYFPSKNLKDLAMRGFEEWKNEEDINYEK